MKKKATLQLTFTFNWSESDESNPLADPYHYAEMYVYSMLRDIDGVDVEVIGIENMEE